jgi:hypothetical protein
MYTYCIHIWAWAPLWLGPSTVTFVATRSRPWWSRSPSSSARTARPSQAAVERRLAPTPAARQAAVWLANRARPSPSLSWGKWWNGGGAPSGGRRKGQLHVRLALASLRGDDDSWRSSSRLPVKGSAPALRPHPHGVRTRGMREKMGVHLSRTTASEGMRSR